MHYTIITASEAEKRSSYRTVRNIATGDTPRLLEVLFYDIDMDGGGDLCLFNFQGSGADEGDGWASILNDDDLEH